MLFTEPRFLFLFLPVVLILYYASPRALKNSVLLLVSILFYGFGEGFYTAVVAGSIVFNYLMGHAVERAGDGARRRAMLVFGVALNLLMLIVFKYAHFIVENVAGPLAMVGVHVRPPEVHLPVGISFFTFHALSYITDVYRRVVKPMRRFDSFALYITLFPQLIAGPIIRYKTICDQFAIADGEPVETPGRRHDFDAFADGVRRFIIGLGKKMLIANVVAEAADGIFAAPGTLITPGAAWLGIVCYTLQIYFDFSGYTDMAIGLGRMFGFVFPENFNYPYAASSVTDFWRRWHMSLSSWFRDYLYIPLGGNRGSAGRTYRNLLIVFFLCGLWHGAQWTFIVWGLYHGFFLVIERLGLGRVLERLPRVVRHVYLVLLVMVGWVFFRAPTLEYALLYLGKMAMIAKATPYDAPAALFFRRHVLWAMIAGAIGSAPLLPALRRLLDAMDRGRTGAPVIARALALHSFEFAWLACVFVVSASCCAAGTYNPFIYFRF